MKIRRAKSENRDGNVTGREGGEGRGDGVVFGP